MGKISTRFHQPPTTKSTFRRLGPITQERESESKEQKYRLPLFKNFPEKDPPTTPHFPSQRESPFRKSIFSICHYSNLVQFHLTLVPRMSASKPNQTTKNMRRKQLTNFDNNDSVNIFFCESRTKTPRSTPSSNSLNVGHRAKINGTEVASRRYLSVFLFFRLGTNNSSFHCPLGSTIRRKLDTIFFPLAKCEFVEETIRCNRAAVACGKNAI